MYDPSVIEEFASRLLRRARSSIVLYTLVGLALGAASGLGVEGNQAMVAGILGVLGALAGYSIGKQKAFQLRLEAHVALCQVAIEDNTRVLADALQHRQSAA